MTGSVPSPAPWRMPEVSGVGREPMGWQAIPHPDAASARRGVDSPWVMGLDGQWRFCFLDRPEAAPDGFAAPDFDDTGWGSIPVPGDWAPNGHGRPQYTNVVMPFDEEPPDVPGANPTGLYRRTVRLPSAWRGRRVVLRVGAAESLVRVWVNGVEVGFGKDSRLPSEWDVTAHLRRGANTIALAVVGWSDASWLEDQDQWWMPGIHRSVSLVSTAPVWLADAALIGGLTGDGTGTLDCDVRVAFADRPVPGWRVEVVVEDLRGRRRGGIVAGEVPTFERGRAVEELLSGMSFAGTGWSGASRCRTHRRGRTRHPPDIGRWSRCAHPTERSWTSGRPWSGSGRSRWPRTNCGSTVGP